MVKHLPTMWETRFQSLGWEDLLEKEMATHSSILAWKSPWTEKPGRLQSMGLQRVGKLFQLFWEKGRDYPEKAMAPHSSALAWKIPWMEEPGR